MEMKLTFAPFVFASSARKFALPYKTTDARSYPHESLLVSVKPRPADAVSLSRMSLSSLLYHALMGEGTAAH